MGNGNILVFNETTNLRYAFADVDGQMPASTITSVVSNSGTACLCHRRGQAYGSDGASHFVQFNSNDTINHVLTGVAATTFTGMWGNPVNGYILSSRHERSLTSALLPTAGSAQSG